MSRYSTFLSPFFFVSLLLAAFACLPVGSVGLNLLDTNTSATWAHLKETVLAEYITNSIWLCLGVASGVSLIGVSTAWLTTQHTFPGQRFFAWALVLPMAMPAYVLAYLYTDLLQFAGPVQTTLRDFFGWTRADYRFPDIRSLGGAIAMFVCVLYPYVYLIARNAFLERAGGMLEAARTLGLGPWRAFFQISLPLARPAIATGIALTLMETLADYGTVAYFGVPTFTTGIYRAWFSLGDRVAAAQLAAALLGFVLILVTLEKISRGKARYHNTTLRQRHPHALQGIFGFMATLVCALPLLAGFLLPATLLLKMAVIEGDAQFGPRFFTLAANSFTLAGISALLAVVLALFLAYAARLSATPLSQTINRTFNRIASLGYAVPGAVIAVGVLIPVTRLDNWLATQWLNLTGHNPGLILTGGIAALVYAYLVRFLAVALQTVEGSLGKITPNMDAAARSLGLGKMATLRHVHAPLLRSSLLTAALLVFVDVMKELPATLVMRPFNFDTLATQTYTLAADERLSEASTAALAIVLVGIMPLIALTRQISRK